MKLGNMETIPGCFKMYPNLISVIDCTEQEVQVSSNLQAGKETFSNFKGRDTMKLMVGLSPNQTVNFVSKAFGGRAGDKHITSLMHCHTTQL